MFGNGDLLAANTVSCEALGHDKQVHYLASGRVKEGSSSTSCEGWSENIFLFGASKSIFQAWELQRFKNLFDFINSYFFLLIPTK